MQEQDDPVSQFEWDEEKNLQNIRKHGIPFEDACCVFQSPYFCSGDFRPEYGEDRYVAVGLLGDVVAVVVFADKGKAKRIISARKAEPKERRSYEAFLRKIQTEPEDTE